jgi:hypothetical protein
MGLLDVLNGMQNGPRGQREPSGSGGGMSPITMAILGLLAYKAVKSFSGGQPTARPTGSAICSRVDWAACLQAVLPEASLAAA